MKCHHCRKNEATVHLVDTAEGRPREVWLCAECAETEQWRRLDSLTGVPGEEDGEAAGLPGPPFEAWGFDSMIRFLGRCDPEAGSTEQGTVCPHCGHRWQDFQATGQLGCARCYTAFRRLLLPLLAGFHRHATHLGRAPGTRSGGGTHLVEISRLRVGLEKAIAAEEFEEAARLRDQLHALESRFDQGGPRE